MTTPPAPGGTPRTPGGPDAFEAEWRFVLDFYALEGVSAACLELQDRLGVDVTVLLHAVWLHCRHGQTPDTAAIETFDAAVRPWRTQVTVPLRALRRMLKSAPFPIPADIVARTRRHIADAELGAEQGAFALLVDMYARIGMADSAAPGDPGDPVGVVVRHYATAGDGPTPAQACAGALAAMRQAVRACRRKGTG